MTKPKTDTTLTRYNNIKPHIHTTALYNPLNFMDKDVHLPDFDPEQTQDLTDSEFVLQGVTVLASTLRINVTRDLRVRVLINCTVIVDEDIIDTLLLGCYIINAAEDGRFNMIHQSTLVGCNITNNRNTLGIWASNVVNLKASNLLYKINIDGSTVTFKGDFPSSLSGLDIRDGCKGIAKVTGLGGFSRSVYILLDQDLKPFVKAGCFRGSLREFSKACVRKYGRGSTYSKIVHSLAKEVKARFRLQSVGPSLVQRVLIERYLNKDNNLYECLAATRAGDHPGLFVVKPKPETGEP